jgi:ribosomal protein S27E
MKVIRKAKPPKQVEAQCRHCGAVLTEAEDKLKWEHDRDGRLARAKCPECKSEVFFY